MSLKRTELRHRMLREVADGQLSLIWPLGFGKPHWRHAMRRLTPGERRALTDMQRARITTYASMRDHVSVVMPTDVGRSVLAEWDAESAVSPTHETEAVSGE